MAAAPAVPAVRRGVRLVDDDQFRSRAEEVAAPAVALDEIRRNDREGIPINYRFVVAQCPVQARRCPRQHEDRVEMELVAQLCLPLLGEVGRAQDRETLYLAAVIKFTGDQAGFDGLPDTDVIGNKQAHRVEPQRQQKWNQLIRSWLERDPSE